ncbi:50S ribosomal protein L30 [candidate division TA06 bacterium]|uniref:50S ribosomal protein L30 n=1 Tax=candidate division TA06 bacterium TaxID=2250710 RepID=A0A933I9W9_UNCT6|nr:50S ribosomal protein L30 [candidate division TA06 bacterium]
MPKKILRITQIHSTIDRAEIQHRTIRALGLRKLYHTVEKADTPQIRGMVKKVEHLLKVEEIKEGGSRK